MPNFKEFIKGFEEPEAKPKAEPKPEVKPEAKPKPKEANVRNWVKKNYPNDSLADNIRGDMTFDDLYKHMQESKDGSDFYEFASEKGKDIDSGVRENIFKGMSDYHGKPYDHFYNMWLEGGKKSQPKPAPKPGSFEKMIEGFDEPEQKQFSKEEIALADKTAEVLSHLLWGDGFEVKKLPNGNYLTNAHLGDPDAEPEEVGPDFILQEREKLLKSGDERFAELWEEYNK